MARLAMVRAIMAAMLSPNQPRSPHSHGAIRRWSRRLALRLSARSTPQDAANDQSPHPFTSHPCAAQFHPYRRRGLGRRFRTKRDLFHLPCLAARPPYPNGIIGGRRKNVGSEAGWVVLGFVSMNLGIKHPTRARPPQSHRLLAGAAHPLPKSLSVRHYGKCAGSSGPASHADSCQHPPSLPYPRPRRRGP